MRLADFYVVAVLSVYNPMGGEDSYTKILCRQLVDETGHGTVYLASSDPDRNPDLLGAKYFDVEVVLRSNAIQNDTAVAYTFRLASARLNTTMSVGQLSTLVHLILDQPTPERCDKKTRSLLHLHCAFTLYRSITQVCVFLWPAAHF